MTDCCMDPRPEGCTAHTVACLLDTTPQQTSPDAGGRGDER